jgi:hypothetical protein
MDAIPHEWVTTDDERCTLRVEDVAFGGTLASLEDEIPPLFHLDITFGGLKHHPLALEVIMEARVRWMMDSGGGLTGGGSWHGMFSHRIMTHGL